MNEQTVHIFGLQRSGTSWFCRVFSKCFEGQAVVRFDLNKHNPDLRLVQRPAIVLIKNPYAWCVSIHRLYKMGGKRLISGAKEKANDFSQFLQGSFGYTVDGTHFTAPSVPEYWLLMNKMATLQGDVDVAVVRYEDMLNHLASTIDGIGGFLKIDRPTCYENEPAEMGPEAYLHPGEREVWDPLSGYWCPKFDRKKYYTNHKWMDAYTPEMFDFMADALNDPFVFSMAGYSVVGPKRGIV